MTTSALWSAVGFYHVVEAVTPQATPDSETLWAGYGAFLIIFLFYVFAGLYHRDRVAATVALGMFLSCVFEIASLWRPLRRSAAAYYLLLAALCLYLAVSKLWAKFRQKIDKVYRSDNADPRPLPIDFVPMGHAMNTLAAAVYAGHVTGVFSSAVEGFTWVLTAGVYLTVAAVVAVRRSQMYASVYLIFHGLFWLTNGFDLTVAYINQVDTPFIVAPTVIHFIIFFILAAFSITRELYQVPQVLSICLLCIAIILGNNRGAFVGAMGWILFVLSLYSLAAHLSRVQNSGFKIPLGAKLLSTDKLLAGFVSACKCCFSKSKNLVSATASRGNHLFSTDFTLGYSRYAGFDLAGFAVNAVAALAILWSPQGVWVLPWALLFGGVAQMVVASISFAQGLSFESCAFFTFGSFWMIWGPARGIGILDQDNSAAVITGTIGFLAATLLLLGLSFLINKAWTIVTFLFNLVVVGNLLHAVNANGSFKYEVVINIVFVVACMYCFLAYALRAVWGREILPVGQPYLQVSYLHSQGEQAFWADGRTASGVKAIADIMNRGGICGIPTDVVYVLVSALKFPKSVERAYNTKKDAEDRPMSMWISKVSQIEEGRPLFGELAWGLMNEIWPSTVSMVVPKGEWLMNLGIGSSEKYIGRPDSIAVRMPDNTVTSHLIDQTGPVATTSANPTGEADTTHHLQVLAKLGLENDDEADDGNRDTLNNVRAPSDIDNTNSPPRGNSVNTSFDLSSGESVVADDAQLIVSPQPTLPRPPHVANQERPSSSTAGIRAHANKIYETLIPFGNREPRAVVNGHGNNQGGRAFVVSDNLSGDSQSIQSGVSSSQGGGPYNLVGRASPLSDGNVTALRFSSLEDDTNPYEPMQFTKSGVEMARAGAEIGGRGPSPAFSVNPLYQGPTTRTKL
ncbi:uncharacterized protein LOC106012772 [Aplysia californica]|uniref:Threonylcarbamoyl-AMP synthase n=1 Tax=Aplysia californica TaxID=6500 RepID=A0ABM1A735_APLCA|nr:uncharacterized protein LOC106012772 [Aplysia californica]